MANLKTCVSSLTLLSLHYLFFTLHDASHTPVHNLAINCGSNNSQTSSDNNNRNWTTDDTDNNIHSKLLTTTTTPTVTAAAPNLPSSLSTVPYATARFSRSRFTYSFHLTRGPKLLRLHFYPASYPGGFNRRNSLFTVKAGHRTLLNHFNASHHADNHHKPQGAFSIQYRINVEPAASHNNNNLNITFTPLSTTHPYAYAFVNGIEVVSYTNNVVKGSNPTPPPTPTKTSKKNTVLPIISSIAIASMILLSIITFFIFRCVKGASSMRDTDTEASNACRHFSIAEIRAATNNFDDALIIGKGGFGNVYKGHIDMCQAPVAIKRLKPGSDQGAREFQTEISMLSKLRHPHLVSLIGYCNDGGEMVLVYDFMARGTLRDHLYDSKEHNPLSWNQRLEICLAAARGLQFLHDGVNRPSVIHRDVKSTNILLDHDWVAKVSDFGLSKVNGPNGSHVTTDVKGSLGYLDPEYYMSLWLTQKSDVYSFGVVLLEVLCGRAPIKRRVDKQEQCLVAWVKRCCYLQGNVDRTIDPVLRGMIRPKCLNKFVEVALSCLNDHGKERPLMKNVVKGLESAIRLQQSASRGGALVREKGENSSEEVAMSLTKIKNVGHEELHDKFWGVNESSGTKATTTCSEEEQALALHGVFSELGNPRAR